jgi:uncharacterized protein (TIGR01244 family)
MEQAAKDAGMEYYHFPVTMMDFPGPHAADMEKLFNDSENPVLAFCRSGTRCTNLWVATRDDDSLDEARDRARSMGYDLGMSAYR